MLTQSHAHTAVSTCHEGWLKLYRNIMGKPIWKETTAEQKVVLITILLRAAYNHRTWVYRGVKYNLKPGQMITSINSLVEMGGPGVTHRKVRTSLDVLEKYGFLTQHPSTQNTLITVENWETYQLETLEPTQRVTQQRHSGDTQPSQDATTIKKLRSKEVVEGVERVKRPSLSVKLPKPCTNEDLEQVLRLYHRHCPSFPQVRQFNEKRRRQVVSCWAELKKLEDAPVLALVEEAFIKAERSPFLKGQNNASWRADFDWLTKTENLFKVLEDKYEPFTMSEPALAAVGKKAAQKTGFHLPQSRKEGYTNDQLEALLQQKRQAHMKKREKNTGVSL